MKMKNNTLTESQRKIIRSCKDKDIAFCRIITVRRYLSKFDLQFWSPKLYRNPAKKVCLVRVDEFLEYLASNLVDKYKAPADVVDSDNVFCAAAYKAIFKRKNHIIRQIEYHFGEI